MRRDSGLTLALGAAAALAAVAVSSAGSKNEERKAAKGRPSQQEIEKGRLRRQILRDIDASEVGVADLEQVATRTGMPVARLAAVGQQMAGTTGYYRKGSKIGKNGPFTLALVKVLKDSERDGDVEAGIRAVEWIITTLPGYAAAFRAGSNVSLAGVSLSSEDLKAEIQGYAEDIGSDDPDGAYISAMKSTLLNGTLDRLYNMQEFSVEQAGRRANWARFVPWLAAQAIDRVNAVRNGRFRGFPAGFDDLKQKTGYILDFAVGTNVDTLGGTSLDDAYAAAQAWHNQNREAADEVKEGQKTYFLGNKPHPTRGKEFFRHKDGMAWVELLTAEDFAWEGNLSQGKGALHHCIGEYPEYRKGTENGTLRSFSLRTPDNHPILTTTIDVDRAGNPLGFTSNKAQIKGVFNRSVGTADPTYANKIIPRVASLGYTKLNDWLEREDEIVVEFLNGIGIPRSQWDGSAAAAEKRIAERKKAKAQAQRKGARQSGPQR